MKLTEKHKKAILAFVGIDSDFEYLSFHSIEVRGKLELKDVRRTVRHLARKGLMGYGQGLWTIDGDPAGSGYCLTTEGKKALNEILLTESVDHDT